MLLRLGLAADADLSFKGVIDKMFEVGHVYKRSSDIHDLYGGQRQGGISTPKDHPYIFIFTSDAGEAHGYRDEFRDDGLFYYTGEGQVGDMSFTAGNKAIQQHQKNSKIIHLFEYFKKAHVRYLGTAEYLDYEYATLKDRENNDRKAIVFQLGINSSSSSLKQSEHSFLIKEDSPEYDAKKIEKDLKKATLQQLRDKAVTTNSEKVTVKSKKADYFYRSKVIKEYTLKRADGICEGCANPAPFKSKTGFYLECHHIHRVADGGPDHPLNVAALCPNCHRRAHFSIDAVAFNKSLVLHIKGLEDALLKNAQTSLAI